MNHMALLQPPEPASFCSSRGMATPRRNVPTGFQAVPRFPWESPRKTDHDGPPLEALGSQLTELCNFKEACATCEVLRLGLSPLPHILPSPGPGSIRVLPDLQSKGGRARHGPHDEPHCARGN